jgi:hypothetical protein
MSHNEKMIESKYFYPEKHAFERVYFVTWESNHCLHCKIAAPLVTLPVMLGKRRFSGWLRTSLAIC